MRNKTFEGINITERTIEVGAIGGSPHLAVRRSSDLPNSYIGITLDPADGVAIALAILEAAGVKPTGHDSYASADHDRTLEDAAWEIRRVVNARAREADAAAKEAADREALEGEAWELFNARNPCTSYKSFSALSGFLVDEWTRIALKARELHKAVS